MTPQHAIGSGFGYRSTAAEVLEGIDLIRPARDRDRRLLRARPGDRARAGRRRRACGGPGAAARPRRGGARRHRRRRGGRARPRRPRQRPRVRRSGSWTPAAASTSSSTTPRSWPAPRRASAPAGRRSSPPTTSATSRSRTCSGPHWRTAAARASSRSPRPATSSRASASTTCSSRPATTSGRPTVRPRAPTACSPCTSTRSGRTRACAPSPPTPAASSRRSSATSPREEMVASGWMDEDGNPDDRFKTPEQGASTSTWAATSPSLDGMGGVYCENCDIAEPTDDRLADRAHRGRRRPRDRPGGRRPAVDGLRRADGDRRVQLGAKLARSAGARRGRGRLMRRTATAAP